MKAEKTRVPRIRVLTSLFLVGVWTTGKWFKEGLKMDKKNDLKLRDFRIF